MSIETMSILILTEFKHVLNLIQLLLVVVLVVFKLEFFFGIV